MKIRRGWFIVPSIVMLVMGIVSTFISHEKGVGATWLAGSMILSCINNAIEEE